MNNINTNEIEAAFSDLIEQLKTIKDLNEIASLHKNNTHLLNEKLIEFYEFSKTQDIKAANILDDYLLKMGYIQQKTEEQSNLLQDKIEEFIISNKEVVIAVDKSTDQHLQMMRQMKKKDVISFTLNAIVAIIAIYLLVTNLI
ncbi:hypothetical protein [Dysgonomonas mossii]|uniref:hypothetical protein n=1 Tax=Dysgonomonas mossii TaxID=163665 RepID=UPI003996A50B